jgi:3-hydroxymyristoyl/3-hydroxydecanoyl-(acyl carrier protein) dehydratase
MSSLSCGPDHSLNANFVFPESFLGFNGHFPGKPILPGVCKIQAVISMLEASKNKGILLKEVALAKFFAPVSCNEEIHFNLKEEQEPSGQIMVKAIITRAEKKIAQLHLRIAIADK